MPKIAINPPDLGPQKTYTTADVTATDTTSLVENNDGFAENTISIFGKLGEEKSELVTVTSVTGNDTIGHTAGLIFSHPARTPIYITAFDQVEVYSATAEGGVYSLLTTITIDVDEPYTVYNDTAGDQNTWYKVRYKNSITDAVSDFTDEVEGSGYTESSLGNMTDQVLTDFGDEYTDEISRDAIKNYLNSGAKKLIQRLIKAYPDYRTAYTTQALTASTATYALPTRFLAFKRVDVNYTGSTATDAYKAIFEGEESGLPSYTYSEYQPRVSIRGSNFVLRPTPSSSSGYAFMWYWDYPASMDNEADEHGLPYGAEEPLVLYALYRAWLPKNKDKANSYRSAFEDSADEFIDFAGQQRQTITNRKVEIVFGDDLYWDGI